MSQRAYRERRDNRIKDLEGSIENLKARHDKLMESLLYLQRDCRKLKERISVDSQSDPGDTEYYNGVSIAMEELSCSSCCRTSGLVVNNSGQEGDNATFKSQTPIGKDGALFVKLFVDL